MNDSEFDKIRNHAESTAKRYSDLLRRRDVLLSHLHRLDGQIIEAAQSTTEATELLIQVRLAASGDVDGRF